jgi:protein-tyrosine phosphatase
MGGACCESNERTFVSAPPTQASFAERLGGRRSAVQYLGYRLAAATTPYWSRWRDVNFASVKRFVFVCSGNICRSPYADRKLRQVGVLESASCGTTAIDGAQANATATIIAGERGVDLSSHLSTSLASMELQSTDLIVALEPQHCAALAQRVAAAQCQITLLGLWCMKHRPLIPDPYGKSAACFRTVFDMVDEGFAGLLQHVAVKSKPDLSITSDE